MDKKEQPLGTRTSIRAVKITQGIKLPMPGIQYGQDFGSISMTIKGAGITAEDIDKFKVETIAAHRKSLEEALTGDSKGIIDGLVENRCKEILEDNEKKLELARKFYKMCKDKFGDSCPEFPTK